MTPRTDDTGIKALEEADIPVVVMGYIPDSTLHSVDVDNLGAAKGAVEHLINLGHRQIACITNAALPYTSAVQRLNGYRLALETAGIAYDSELVREGDFETVSGYKQMKTLLDSGKKFSAIFVASDAVALGAYNAIREAGLTIPDDISIIGFDDLPLSTFISPALTTVRMPAREIAQDSCYLLMRLMKHEFPESRMISLPTTLIIRESTRNLVEN